MTAQDTLERLSATISEEYYMAKALKRHADEPVYLDDYRSKKEINYAQENLIIVEDERRKP